MSDITNLAKRKYLIKIDPSISKGNPGEDGQDANIEDFLPLDTSDIVHDGVERNGEALDVLLDELLYQTMIVGALTSASGNLFEKGVEISAMALSWSLSKDAVSQVLDATNLDTIVLDGNDITANVTFTPANSADFTITLTVTDSVGDTIKTLLVQFVNKIYYGVSGIPGSVNSAFVLSLANQSLQGTEILDTVFTTGVNEYFWFCLPTAYGTPVFTSGGFTMDMTLEATISLTNASGHTEEYKIWRTTNPQLGTTSFESNSSV